MSRISQSPPREAIFFCSGQYFKMEGVIPSQIKTLPMLNFTLDELADFTRKEEEMVRDLMPGASLHAEPSEQSIQNILAYSKALSVRRSKHLKHVRLVLN